MAGVADVARRGAGRRGCGARYDEQQHRYEARPRRLEAAGVNTYGSGGGRRAGNAAPRGRPTPSRAGSGSVLGVQGAGRERATAGRIVAVPVFVTITAAAPRSADMPLRRTARAGRGAGDRLRPASGGVSRRTPWALCPVTGGPHHGEHDAHAVRRRPGLASRAARPARRGGVVQTERHASMLLDQDAGRSSPKADRPAARTGLYHELRLVFESRPPDPHARLAMPTRRQGPARRASADDRPLPAGHSPPAQAADGAQPTARTLARRLRALMRPPQVLAFRLACT